MEKKYLIILLVLISINLIFAYSSSDTYSYLMNNTVSVSPIVIGIIILNALCNV